MKNKYLIWASLVAATILSAGCVKEKNYDEIRVPGEPIRFAAETGYENGDGTRTEYSGKLYGTESQYERINWLADDPMKIIYVQGSAESSANYKVTSVTGTTDENSYADVTVDGNELVWGAGSGTNKFYAMYPTAARNSSASLVKTGSTIRATGTVLADQSANVTSGTQSITVNGNTWTRYQPDMDYNYLLAYADDETGISGGSVRLPFRPAVTAFEFRFQLKSGYSDRKVTKFELISSRNALSGQFKIDIIGGNTKGAIWNTLTAPTNVPTRTAGNSVITVNFPTGGVSLPAEGYLDFTVFALPSNLSGLTMRLTYVDGKHAELPLKVSATEWYEFTGARKYIITNSKVPGSQDWTYVIEPIDDQTFVGHTPIPANAGDPYIGYNVKSYKWNSTEGEGVKYPVTWKTQYYDENSHTWKDVPSTGIIPDSDYAVNTGNVTGSGVGTADYSTGEDRSARLDNSTTPVPGGDVEHSPATIIHDLSTRSRPTDQPFDLSMHDVFGNPHSQTTANSYVITRPGVYKFPVVYGNAITNGRDYKEAYWPVESTDAQLKAIYNTHKNETTFRYLPRFRNAANGYIAAGNILEDFETWNNATGTFELRDPNAAIVWQNSMKLYDAEEAKAIVLEDDVNYADGYITFEIKEENIRPGNVVIAFRGGVGSWLPDDSVLWSWQIWVTANDLSPVAVSGGKLMPFNLGYIDSTPAGSYTYPNRSIKFRILQVEDGVEHENEEFTLEQRGDGHAWDANVGYNVYYQWGRKDPMIPAKDHDAVTRTQTFPAPTGTISRVVYPDADFVRGRYFNDVNAKGKDIEGNAPYFYGIGQADYRTGITHPYFAYLNTFSTGWVGGSFNGSIDSQVPTEWQTETLRQESSIPINLWNNAMWTTMDGNTGLGMYKTIYDPCPPGFCVPTVGALSSFTLDSVEGTTTEGVYFRALNGRTVFLPYSGLRVFYNNGDGTAELWAEEVRQGGFYWTDSAYGSIGTTTNGRYYYSIHFSFGIGSGSLAVNAVTPISDFQHYTKGSSLAIRPMVDPKYRVE